MSADRWEETKALFERIADLREDERLSYIASRGTAPEVAAEALRLLAFHSAVDPGFLSQVTRAPGEFLEGAVRVVAESFKTVLPAGRVIAGRYEIMRELGSGGGGIVYLAHDHSLERRPVVLKFPLANTQLDVTALRRFETEVRALARIRHEGVVGALDVGQTADGRSFLVMEFIEGETLRSLLSNGLTVPRIENLVCQIASALTAAHEAGILHRDLKPENIMVTRGAGGSERVKLIDFGIARVQLLEHQERSQTLTFAGTVNYIAPEQLMGQATACTDVFSLGVVVYEMLTGQRPFNPETPFDLYEQQKRGAAIPPSRWRPELGGGVDRVVLKALSFEMKRRHESAAKFAGDLSVELSRPSSISSRYRWRTVLAGACVAVLVPVLAPVTRLLTRFAGDPLEVMTTIGGQPPAQLGHIFGVAADREGSVYFTATGQNQIYKMPPGSRGKPVLVAGSGAAGFAGDGGDPLLARFNNPVALALDRNGELFVTDQNNNRIRKISFAQHSITTVAGSGERGFGGDGGHPLLAKLASPLSIAFDSGGGLYVADRSNHRVRVIHMGSNPSITTVAGNGVDGFAGDGGDPLHASLSGPTGLAFDAAGTLYIADQQNNRIRAVSFGARAAITTISGTGQAAYGGDNGDPRAATLAGPIGLAVDSLGRLLIADSGNHRIRRINFGPSPVISTAAGTGLAGLSGDGGPATSARLSSPSAVAVGARGEMYIADYLNDRVRGAALSSARPTYK